MRDLGTATVSHLAARAGICVRLLLWISARNRSTGAIETLGLWNGDDHATITVGAESRTYFGAGAMISVDPVVTQIGVQVRTQRVSLSPASAEVLQAIQGYDARLAPAEIHRGLFDAAGAPIGIHRIFKGVVDAIELPRPAAGRDGTVTVTLASAARALTRTVASKFSDGSMALRQGDRMFRYADVSGSVPVYWGETKGKA